MTLSNTPGALSKFGRTSWRFQVTFATPLQGLELFVSTILANEGVFEKGVVTIGSIIFEPKNLDHLLVANSLPTKFGRDWSICAEGKAQVHDLLKATLGDWVDFSFTPTPKPFVIYADHDEFTTFFSNTKSNLNQVVQPLLKNGFIQIQGYQREL